MDGAFGDNMAGSTMVPLYRQKLLRIVQAAPLMLLAAASAKIEPVNVPSAIPDDADIRHGIAPSRF